MKTTNKFLSLCISALCVVSLVSCEDAEKGKIDNLLYFSEASSAKTKTVSLAEGNTSTTVTVRLAKALDADLNATVSIDNEYLEAYNKTNETDYQVLGTELFTFNSSVSVKAGNVSSEPVEIEILEFNPLGVKYAIPLKVVANDGDIQSGESTSHFIIFLEKPLKQYVPQFTYKSNMSLEEGNGWPGDCNNITLEWWVKMSGFSVNNQAIFSVGGSGELYIRFGDLVYANGYSYVYNFLQVKAMGSQFDTGDPTAGNGLDKGTWYHFAYTYDAATGTSLLYKNGEQIGKLNTSAGVPKGVTGCSMVSSGQTYFRDKCELCQVRLWKTTRTQAQIQNNMNGEVDPKDPNLIFYLPMNEGDGATFYDATGNGHNATAGSNATVETSVPWNIYTFAN